MLSTPQPCAELGLARIDRNKIISVVFGWAGVCRGGGGSVQQHPSYPLRGVWNRLVLGQADDRQRLAYSGLGLRSERPGSLARRAFPHAGEPLPLPSDVVERPSRAH
jgi:hypothetical protein